MAEKSDVYDLIIIGAGPAGLTAAIYAARYRLNLLVIAKETGGMAAVAHKVCNYPSYREINGFELMQKMKEHAESLGAPILLDEVAELEKKDGIFLVKTKISAYQAKKVIFAAGTERKKLGINNEEEFVGKGVSYCATCDGAFFKNKIVGVVGGSDAALTAGLLIAEYATKVFIIYRNSDFSKAEPTWTELVMKNKKIECLFNEEVAEIFGDKMLKGVRLKSGKTVELNGLFIEIGSVPKLYSLKNLDVKQEKGYIITNERQETSVPGLYAAGDVVKSQMKQIVTAASHGAVAAYNAYKEIAAERK